MTSVGGKVIRFKVKVKRNASYQGDKYLLYNVVYPTITEAMRQILGDYCCLAVKHAVLYLDSRDL